MLSTIILILDSFIERVLISHRPWKWFSNIVEKGKIYKIMEESNQLNASVVLYQLLPWVSWYFNWRKEKDPETIHFFPFQWRWQDSPIYWSVPTPFCHHLVWLRTFFIKPIILIFSSTCTGTLHMCCLAIFLPNYLVSSALLRHCLSLFLHMPSYHICSIATFQLIP